MPGWIAGDLRGCPDLQNRAMRGARPALEKVAERSSSGVSAHQAADGRYVGTRSKKTDLVCSIRRASGICGTIQRFRLGRIRQNGA